MKRRWAVIGLGLMLLLGQPGFGAEGLKHWKLVSPDGKLTVLIEWRTGLSLVVDREGKVGLPLAFAGFTLEQSGSFPGKLSFLGQSTRNIDESYTMPVGKRSLCRNHARELTLDFGDSAIKFSFILRAYNEGIAYRYRIHGSGTDRVLHEESSWGIPPNARGWFAPYKPQYESPYTEHSGPGLRGFQGDIQMPALFEMPSGVWTLLTEAAVDGNYSGARLKVGNTATEDPEPRLLTYQLADQPSAPLPWETPWRVAFVVSDLRDLVESTLINDLSPPSEIKDTSWIKPGTNIFPWLTGPETNNMSLERMKQFVDLAAEMGWGWIEFDNALALGKQSGDPPEKWMAAAWIPEVAAYANSKGIAVYGWDHWSHLDTPEKRAFLLDWFVAHGFKGIKVDFLDSDIQARNKFREEIARACAERKLLLSFHGDITPRGLQRKWPNIATHEGVMGEEYYLFGKEAPTPAYNVNLVFTRNVPGSMDYTPTTFDLPGKTPTGRRTTTNAHEMALAVVFESGWQSMGFNPESVKGNPAREFLKGLPSAWDDARFIDGRPGEFAVLARRKGSTWWIGGINAGTAREVELKLGFLKPGRYATTLYHDARVDEGNGNNGSNGRKEMKPLETRIAAERVSFEVGKDARPLKIAVPANGGFGMKIAGDAALKQSEGAWTTGPENPYFLLTKTQRNKGHKASNAGMVY